MMEEKVLKHKRSPEQSRKRGVKSVEPQDKDVSQQLTLIGHEIKSPLTRIIALSEFMLSDIPGTLNEEQKEYVHDICSNSYLLKNSINLLLNVSRSECGCLSLNLAPSGIEDIIEGVVSKVDSLAVSRNDKLEVEFPSDIPVLNLDREKVEQVLFNLVDNALKFTANGTIRITVEDNQPTPDFVMLSVCDTGTGMDKDIQDKAFDKFFTKKTGMNPNGSGLGLTLVKEFVELHGGSVWIDSPEGKGTRVDFTLAKNLKTEKGELSSDACGCE